MLRFIVIVLPAFACVAPFAHADVLVSNIDEPIRASTAIGGAPNLLVPTHDNDGWYWAGQSFVTDGSSYALDSIDVVCGDGNGVPVTYAELRADDAGAIGATLMTLSVPNLFGPIGPRTFVPDAPVALDPNTTYWLVISADAPANGGFYWSYADTGFFSGAGALAGFAFSSDSGALWAYGADFPWMIRVNVASQPPCPGDLNGDRIVDLADLAGLLAAFGTISTDPNFNPAADLDLSSSIDLADLAGLLAVFGASC
ncbi:MAG: hypothetical protein KDA32_15430 [Phycisphaerales bacterium]|nr:hypothetical protein [Phycisphaerales bacterium]